MRERVTERENEKKNESLKKKQHEKSPTYKAARRDSVPRDSKERPFANRKEGLQIVITFREIHCVHV